MARVYIEKGMKAEINTNVAFAIEQLVDLIDDIGIGDEKQDAINILIENNIKFEEV